ncbi:sigma factor-like helix-turn-helix DNA-binding protein [Streptomyces sp. NPDC057199]|uniref:sigma factor-like helix-turn-helix DNA-binding protein n=1 Tax=Streptomyces sp. NPDC057199 TaxID=3346047 RepID=UPI00363A5C42
MGASGTPDASAVQQRILTLRSEGFRPKDIARQVGRPEATTRSHLRHARSRLSTLTQHNE